MTKIRVHEFAVDNALDMMDVLNPSSGLFGSGRLYRGQADSRWGLLPSVFRDDVPYLLPEEYFPRNVKVYGAQVKLEVELLWLFVARANESGLAIPGNSEHVRELLDRIRFDGYWVMDQANLRMWPPRDLIPALALSQHHGVPTRLLDWTLDPYTALYFAAEGAARKGWSEGHLAVWVCTLSEDRRFVNGARSVQIERPSNASNPNLGAQRGCLMVWRKGSAKDDPFDAAPLEVSLSQEADRAGLTTESIFYKLTLPQSESGALLAMLSTNRVDGSTLFPGFDGVARVVRERVHWSSPGGNGRGELNRRKNKIFERYMVNLPVFRSPLELDEDGDYGRLRKMLASTRNSIAAGDYDPFISQKIEVLNDALREIGDKVSSGFRFEISNVLDALKKLQ